MIITVILRKTRAAKYTVDTLDKERSVSYQPNNYQGGYSNSQNNYENSGKGYSNTE